MRNNKLWTTFIFISLLVILAILVDIPTVPSWVPGHQWFSKLKIHLGLDLQGGTQLIYETDTADIPADQRSSAIEGARDVIERRVNIFGVAEPLIQTAKAGDEWRIIVELPGVKKVGEAIKMIGETPILEFKEQALPRELTAAEKKEIANYNKKAEKRANDILQQVLKPGADFSALAKEYSEDPGSKNAGGDLGWLAKGVTVSEFEQTVLALENDEIAKNLTVTPFGYHIIQKLGERKNEKGEEEFWARHILIATKSEESEAAGGGWAYTGLTGKQLKSAIVSFDSQTNEPQVALEFNDEGTKLFGDITTRNVSKPVAIFLDGSPISIPTVREPITSGKAVISGKFNLKEAKELAQRLSAGALPVPIKLVGQQNIGPSLGRIAVEKSFIAGIIGFLAVAIFMILSYGRYGLIATTALSVYALINIALYKLIPVTLTLAGIAGFIISIGMAIDANVLIFERIKDERRLGKMGMTVINDGFRHAWTAIRDSNVTTLISCFILYQFGTGLVRGFGLTLGIGVLISIFTAITVTKTILKLTMR